MLNEATSPSAVVALNTSDAKSFVRTCSASFALVTSDAKLSVNVCSTALALVTSALKLSVRTCSAPVARVTSLFNAVVNALSTEFNASTKFVLPSALPRNELIVPIAVSFVLMWPANVPNAAPTVVWLFNLPNSNAFALFSFKYDTPAPITPNASFIFVAASSATLSA